MKYIKGLNRFTENANFDISVMCARTQTDVATKLHKSRLQLWKRKLLHLIMLVLEESTSEGEGKVTSPGRGYSKNILRASSCLSDSVI